jgi:hypothetical protein
MNQSLQQQRVPDAHSRRPPTAEYRPPVPVRLIPLDQIVPNPHQPRRHFDDDALQELADSIRQHGVLQPILLRQRANDRFEIIAGERRFRAAKMAGLTAIPALVRKFDDRDSAELSLIENLQREDLNPVETPALSRPSCASSECRKRNSVSASAKVHPSYRVFSNSSDCRKRFSAAWNEARFRKATPALYSKSKANSNSPTPGSRSPRGGSPSARQSE